jgi:hypothetical protein
MANCILAAPNYVDTEPRFADVRFSGGIWKPTLPLTNLRSRFLADVARSVNASNDSTQLIIDLGQQRDIRVAAVPNASVSRNANGRLRGYANATLDANGDVIPSSLTGLVCDSGWKPWYPVVYPFGSLPYPHPSFWDGKLSEEDADGYPIPWIHVFPSAQIARFWKFEVSDQTNPNKFVDLTRIILAPGWQPKLNMIYGASTAWESETQIDSSLGGARFYDVRPKRRVVQFSFDYLEQDEALSRAFDINFRLGVDKQFFWIFDPDDTFHLHRRSFLATLRQLSQFEYPVFNRLKVGFSAEEVTG